MVWLELSLLGLAAAIFIALAYKRRWRWAGFAEVRRPDLGIVQPRKTLWDWLQLLVIPLALAGLAFLLNSWQSDREQRREDDRAVREQRRIDDSAKEQALRAYLAKMSGLMLDRKLLRSQPGSDVRAVARTITVTTLRRLDRERKGVVVRFLDEAGLLAFEKGRLGSGLGNSFPTLVLDGANLRFTALAGASLEDASLRGADLARADLARAWLHGADLSDAKLRRAHLRRVMLAEATLQNSDLSRADLQHALLWDADLYRARLVRADLRGAVLLRANLQSANLRRADLRGHGGPRPRSA